jgi:hypothetical protein
VRNENAEQSVERERAITSVLKTLSNAPAALTPAFARKTNRRFVRLVLGLIPLP